jgi:hypothetical protein
VIETILNKLERRFGRFEIPRTTEGLILLQVVTYVLSYARPEILQRIYLIPAYVLQGEVWRLFTFLAIPPVTNPFFAFFFWYLFYLMGTALEAHWGTFRYNIYLFIGYFATVVFSFLTPLVPATNAFVQGSVYLAFAFLYPDFQLYLLFIIPVKIKWLAMLTWAGYLYVFIFGDWSSRYLVFASILNFLLFFGQDILDRIRTGRRRMEYQAKQFGAVPKQDYYHRCTTCGITDKTHPDMDFRYCTQCHGTCGYCSEHLKNHAHVTAESVAATTPK